MKQRQGISIRDTSLARITQLLRPSSLPASVGTPPAAVASAGSRGNREISVSTMAYKPQDATLVQFVNGIAHWNFATKFNKPPIVLAMVVGGASSGAPTGTYVFIEPGYPNATTVIVNSTWTGDGRLVHLQAVGNPD